MFFARFVLKIIFNLKPMLTELRIILAQTSAEISPPPKTKNPGYVPLKRYERGKVSASTLYQLLKLE